MAKSTYGVCILYSQAATPGEYELDELSAAVLPTESSLMVSLAL